MTKQPLSALRAVALSAALALAAPAASAQNASLEAPAADPPPLARLSIEDAMACVSYLKEGIEATRAEIGYRYEDARGARRDGTIDVCRQWRGRLTAGEASSIRQAIMSQHPDQKNVASLRVVAQD
jgi:hypothetical protein